MKKLRGRVEELKKRLCSTEESVSVIFKLVFYICIDIVMVFEAGYLWESLEQEIRCVGTDRVVIL